MSPLPSPSPALVLDALRRHADYQGDAAPGLRVLAREVSYGARQVQRHLQRLRQDGFVANVAPTGRCRPARYRLMAPDDSQGPEE